MKHKNFKTVILYFTTGLTLKMKCKDWKLKYSSDTGKVIDFTADNVVGPVVKYMNLAELMAVVEDA